jgi:hypothetical protein
MQLAIEIAGWTGAALILLSYLLLSAGKLGGHSRLYQWMNVFGALGFIINSGAKHAYPSMSLNIIWIGIGLVTLWRMGRRRENAQ